MHNNFTLDIADAILSKFEISKDYVTFQKKFLQSDSYKRAIRAQKPVVIEFGTKAYPEKGKSLLSRFMSTIVRSYCAPYLPLQFYLIAY